MTVMAFPVVEDPDIIKHIWAGFIPCTVTYFLMQTFFNSLKKDSAMALSA